MFHGVTPTMPVATATSPVVGVGNRAWLHVDWGLGIGEHVVSRGAAE